MPIGEEGLRRAFYHLGSFAFVVALLYWAQPVLMPVAIAVLCTFVLAPIVGMAERHGVPRVVGSLFAVALAAVVVVGVGYVVFVQIDSFASQLPQYKTQLSEKIGHVREATAETWVVPLLDAVSQSANNDVPIFPFVRSATGTAIEIVVNIVVVLALAFLMLLRREDLRNRVIRLLGVENVVTTTRVFDEASRRISRFLLFQLILNLGFGVVVACALFLIGLPYPYLWGALAALLRYVPFLGGWLAAALPLLTSLIMPGWTPFFLTAAFFITAELLQASVVEPLVFGHSVGLSAAGQLVAALFWAYLWGPVGLILSTPLTACICVLGYNFPLLNFFSVLMGDQPVVGKAMAFYQRLLAGDLAEAADLVETHLHEYGCIEVVDDLLLPALISAHHDQRQGDLSKEDQASIVEGVRDVFNDVVETPDPAATKPESKQAPVGGRVLLPEFAFHDDADRAVLDMLKAVAGDNLESCEAENIADVDTALAGETPSTILLTTFAKRNLGRLRVACKKIRAVMPKTRIIIACWSLENDEALLGRLKNVGAHAVCRSFLQVCKFIGSDTCTVRPDRRAGVRREVAPA